MSIWKPATRDWSNRKASNMMNDYLSFAQIVLLIGYAGGMAGGQILFKMAALKGVAEGPWAELWVWILNFTPLSRAYVFVALAFAVTPLLGAFVFAEPISIRLVIGIGLVFCGLLFVAG